MPGEGDAAVLGAADELLAAGLVDQAAGERRARSSGSEAACTGALGRRGRRRGAGVVGGGDLRAQRVADVVGGRRVGVAGGARDVDGSWRRLASQRCHW